MTVYYAETERKIETFEKWTEDLFIGEELVWLDKEEIYKRNCNKCNEWIDYLEKGCKIFPLSYLEDENLCFG